MASTQRADRFEQLYKALKKHYKPVTPPSDRKVLDHLMYACCLEDATYEAADEAFAKLQQAYFDSNELRVTTVAELSESLTSLPKASAAAARIKKSLQSMFEARYSFDIDDLKKANLGKAVDEITAWQGMSKYVIAYLTQHALGGHAIPVSQTVLDVCHTLDLVTYAEIEKVVLPGVERAIAKSKGVEFASLLHQFAVDYSVNYKHPLVAAVFKDLGLATKPKAPPPPPPPSKPAPKPAAKPEVKGKIKPAPAATESAKPSKPAEPALTKKVEPAPKPTKSAPPAPVKSAVKPEPAKPTTKKEVVAKPGKEKEAPKAPAKIAAKPASKPAVKPSSKPAPKPAAKKPEPKKTDTKKKPAPPAKPKSASSGNKAPTKRLPVKPATNKKTKPK